MTTRFGLVADRGLRFLDDGRVVVGGDPTRLLRLRGAGPSLVRRWLAGWPATLDDGGAGRLARRLVDAGAVTVRPLDGEDADWRCGAVVIPCRDDADGLASTLGLLRPALDAGLTVVVVDDASGAPLPIPDDVERIVLAHNLGPAGARNAALDHLGTRTDPPAWVVTIDAGVRVSGSTLRALVAALAEPDVAAVAPRIRSAPGPGWRSRYERRHSPLDLGDRAGLVGPGRRVGHVPTACLVMRTDAGMPRFDAELRSGEDVDLVWRLVAAGRRVRYRPDLEVEHPPRDSWTGFVRQRHHYGTAAADLGERHGDAVTPVRWSPAAHAPVAALLAAPVVGGPAAVVTAAGTATWSVRRLVRRLGDLPDADRLAVRLVGAAGWAAVRNIAEVGVRSWWPATALALVVPAARPVGATVVLLGALRRGLDPRMAVTGLVDDVAYGTGVWTGAWRRRSLTALRPVRVRPETDGE